MGRKGTLLAAAVVPAAALLLALAGCGSGGRLTKPEYEQRLRQAGQELVRARAQLSRSKPKDEFKKGVEAVQGALGKAADRLDGITPPVDAEPANARLVAALRKLAKDWDEVKSAADESPDAALAKAQKVARGQDSRNAFDAITEIQRRGYDVGQLGGR
jgi:predicted small lipoprotein YifL